MTRINPAATDYESHDGLKIAKDISWVIKTLWAGAGVIVLATVWVVALANDVSSNTEKIKEAATQEQVATIITALGDIKDSLKSVDSRQRDIKSSVDKLEQQVDDIKKRNE